MNKHFPMLLTFHSYTIKCQSKNSLLARAVFVSGIRLKKEIATSVKCHISIAEHIIIHKMCVEMEYRNSFCSARNSTPFTRCVHSFRITLKIIFVVDCMH